MTPVFKYLFIIIGLSLITNPLKATPDAVLIEKWTAYNPASTQQIDHSPFDLLLSKYRFMGDDGIARFAYGKVSAADRTHLDSYLKQLSQTPLSSLNRKVQFAFWVNLYNSLTIRVILDHYPVTSIRDINISPGLFSSGPWGADLITIDGSALSLDNIEHGIIRPLWKDPRAHYVLNCASLGCPDLPKQALTPGTLEATLNHAAETFINHPRAAQITNGTLDVSSIYNWFSSDFGEADAAIIAHLKTYAAANLNKALGSIQTISGDFYDWQLNQ